MQNSTARLLCSVHCTVGVSSEFDADFESVTKIAKSSCEKSYQQKKATEKWIFLTFVAVLQNFWLTNFFGRTFAFFFNGFELCIKFRAL
jgi:hypothetical protein